MIDNYTSLIYLVDADQNERHRLQTSFRKRHAWCQMRCFANGDYLRTQLTHVLDGRLPDLIILDLNQPVLGNLELLHYLRQDQAYQSIPVVGLSALSNQETVECCNTLQMEAYLQKTPDCKQLITYIHSMRAGWCSSIGTEQTVVRNHPTGIQIKGLYPMNLHLN